MNNKIKSFVIQNKYKSFNKKTFNNSLKSSKSQILVEFNAYSSIHILSSFLSNFLSQKTNSKIVAFDNHSLVVRPLERNFLDKIKWFLINKFNLKTISIYKSFGVSSFFYPNISKDINRNSLEIYDKIYNKLTSKNDINDISILGMYAGDLIIDGYIKYRKTYKIDIKNDDFKNYLLDFIRLFLFWENYFKKNNVHAVIGSMVYYASGIVHRIGVIKNIKCYVFYNGKVINLKKNKIYANDQYKSHKLYFNKFNKNQKEICYKIAKNFIRQKLEGSVGEKINELSTDVSAFSKKFNVKSKVLANSKKIKILIATHEIFDACHVYGKNYFCDFQTWLYFLGETSKNTNYEWYIKDHPLSSGRRSAGQLLTAQLTDEIIKKYPSIKFVDSHVSHHQLINEGIDFVLTVYGTITWEYALFNVPVILATNNCAFNDYNFYIDLKNKDEYSKTLKSLEKLKKPINFNKDEIYEFYYMHYVFGNNNFIIKNYDNFLKQNNTFYDYYNYKFYDYFIKNFQEKDREFIFSTFESFYNSDDYILNVHNTNIDLDIFLKRTIDKEDIWKE